ncbi:MAG: leucyl aminopeptidase [Alphaproteobacteria bacterium]|nr:leucyl aminopeptidase [Alphaproteobacteria bacterium]
MQIKFTAEPAGDALAYFAYEGEKGAEFGGGVDKAAEAAFRRAITASSFKGSGGQMLEFLAPEWSDSARVILFGVGKKKAINDVAWQKAAAGVVKKLLISGAKSLSIVGAPDRMVAANFGFGARLAAYRFDQYRLTLKSEKKPTLTTVSIVTDSAAGARSDFAPLAARAEGVEFARDLVSEPPNVLYPESYAERIAKLSELGLEIEVLDVPAMTKLGMGSLLGVGQGSARPSRLCVLKWMGSKEKKSAPVALVGKGVTFDTGGISLKPGPGMEDMKGDMGGSAAVVGAMIAIAKRKAKANVVGLVGLVENMPDGNAQRPGDIVKAAAGKTIEVLNTDAEGRLVLADVLWYAQKKFNPKAIVDLATLTGAIIISLGHEHAGVFSNNDELADKLTVAGKAAGEPVWRLPLGPGYDKQLDSDVADMKNIGGRSAGSITAAQFLQRFVDEGRAWAHLDIAGTAWKPGNDNPMEPVWATGWGVRILDQLVADNYED